MSGKAVSRSLNPFRPNYGETRASKRVKVGAQVRHVGQSAWPITLAVFSFHGAVCRTLPEAHGVMRMHTTPTMAVRCLEADLADVELFAAERRSRVDSVAHHDFEGITAQVVEGALVLASAAGKPVRLPRKRGPVVSSHTLAHALR